MRIFLGLLVAGGIVGAVVMQKQRQAPDKQPAAPKPAVVATAKAPTAAPAGQPAAQHWPKRALDRAADVKRQVADKNKADETR